MLMVQPSLKLPAVVAITDVRDHGPSDGEGSASCPHCGARGRYVIHFICEDGSRRGAMKGCFKLFPGSFSPVARLTQEAFDRQATAKKDGKKLATWWAEIVAAAEELSKTPEAVQAFIATVNQAEGRRRTWLNKNGYGKWARR